MTDTDSAEAPDRILTPRFAVLAGVAVAYFVAMGSTFPVLPRFVRDTLDAGDTAVGVVLGSMAIGAILARPVLGLVGDRYGRSILIIAGGLISSAAMIGHLGATSIPVLVLLRVAFGVGQGATIVGATTLAVDLAPPERSGEATSYIFVALHLGAGIGALLGEWLLRTSGFNAVWVAAGVGMAISGIVGLGLQMGPADNVVTERVTTVLLHPTAVLPGLILGLGGLGFIGFNAFIPLLGDEIGVENVAPFFLASSLTIVLIRGFGARLPDRLGPVRGGTIALCLAATGLTVIGSVRTATGLGIGAVVLASGTALLLPSLVTAAVRDVPINERSRAMATYTLFLEISAALGAFMFGGVAAASSYGSAYLVAAAISLSALVLLRLTLARR